MASLWLWRANLGSRWMVSHGSNRQCRGPVSRPSSLASSCADNCTRPQRREPAREMRTTRSDEVACAGGPSALVGSLVRQSAPRRRAALPTGPSLASRTATWMIWVVGRGLRDLSCRPRRSPAEGPGPVKAGPSGPPQAPRRGGLDRPRGRSYAAGGTARLTNPRFVRRPRAGRSLAACCCYLRGAWILEVPVVVETLLGPQVSGRVDERERCSVGRVAGDR